MPTRIPIYRDEIFERLDKDKAEIKAELHDINLMLESFQRLIWTHPIWNIIEEKIDKFEKVVAKLEPCECGPKEVSKPVTKKK